MIERSKLVATKEDLVKIKKVTLMLQQSVQEKEQLQSGSSTHSQMSEVTVAHALFRKNPMGFKDRALPQPLLNNHTVHCPTYKENTRKPHNDILGLFRAVASKWTTWGRSCSIYSQKKEEIGPASCVSNISNVEVLIQVNIFLYHLDVVDGALIEKLVMRTVGKHSNTVGLFS